MQAEIERLYQSNCNLRAAFRVNMIRAYPNLSHAEIDAKLNEISQPEKQ